MANEIKKLRNMTLTPLEAIIEQERVSIQTLITLKDRMDHELETRLIKIEERLIKIEKFLGLDIV